MDSQVMEAREPRGGGTSALLEASGLSVRLGPEPASRLLFEGVGLSVAAGECVDLVGPSGSGKTMLLRTLARLHPYATGALALDGTPASGFTPQAWRMHVAMLPQKAAFLEGTVGSNLLAPFALAIRAEMPKPDEATMCALLNGVGLQALQLDGDISRLSVGQAARVALCRTLLTQPDVLLLDEADAALDSESVGLIGAVVSSYIAQGNRAALRIRHREDDGYTTRRLVLQDGVLSNEGEDA